jgi:recombination protein RecT
MNASAIVPFKEKVATVQQLLKTNRDAIQQILPKHLTIDRMIKVINLVVRRTPKLLDCTPQSLLGAVMEAASLGLEPGILGQAYFVPFRNKSNGKLEVQLIAGYKGLIQLCRNTGELSTVGAQIVYQNDKFEASLGTDPRITHIPTEDANPGQIRASYAIAKLKDGAVQFDLMYRRDLEKIRKRSKSADSGPWVTDPEEMCKKTVIRRLAKLLPASTEKLQRVVELDEQAEAGISQQFDLLDTAAIESQPMEAIEAPKSALDQVVEEGKRKKAGKPAVTEFADSEPDPFESGELSKDREPGSDDM